MVVHPVGLGDCLWSISLIEEPALTWRHKISEATQHAGNGYKGKQTIPRNKRTEGKKATTICTYISFNAIEGLECQRNQTYLEITQRSLPYSWHYAGTKVSVGRLKHTSCIFTCKRFWIEVQTLVFMERTIHASTKTTQIFRWSIGDWIQSRLLACVIMGACGSSRSTAREGKNHKPPKQKYLDIKGPCVLEVLKNVTLLSETPLLPFVNLAFSGGGIKGYAFIGTIQVSYCNSRIFFICF